MFLGEYKHLIDVKGRVALPARFKAGLRGGLVITRGFDGCLFVYPNEEWKKLAQKLILLPIARSNTRAFVRLMLAGAMDVKIDGQGRIVIPDYLRKYAFIKQKTVIAGLYNRLEIWDEDKWEQYKADTEKNSNDIAEQLGEIGV
ncbi:MAG: cell division/cell wall cluster transcriptional repressor MraZ [Parcubacteria group bacterium GW2011_GWA2_38_13b]|nr:MAG: cell division/cell wall cluster transcriptional repressor MraZ [Parcubacteria group bacterium GW2011_GWA2_38_13b]